jgi:hypothetical protein
MLGGFTRSLSALVHFTLHTGAGVDSVVYKQARKKAFIINLAASHRLALRLFERNASCR